MNAVLLLLSPELQPNRALACALQRAKERGATLFAVVVITAHHLQQLAAQLVDRGFIGEKLSENVVEHVREEQTALAENVLEAVRTAATREGVPVETRVVEGEFADACEAALARFNVVHAVLAVPARAWFERLWGQPHAPAWASDLGCPFESVEE